MSYDFVEWLLIGAITLMVIVIGVCIVMAIIGGGGPVDLCREAIHHAKWTDYVQHHGWYAVNNRAIWCGPGLYP
jgi:hypothetical protein